MATKAAMMGDRRSFDKIMTETVPHRCKYLGRSVNPFDQEVWTKYLVETATAVCMAKFASEELWQVLDSTGNMHLAEASPTDCIWGIGLSADDPRVNDPAQWNGQNILGRALMLTRSSLRAFKNCPP